MLWNNLELYFFEIICDMFMENFFLRLWNERFCRYFFLYVKKDLEELLKILKKRKKLEDLYYIILRFI